MKHKPGSAQKRTLLVGVLIVLMTGGFAVTCGGKYDSRSPSSSSPNAPIPPSPDEQPLDPGMVAQGKEIFRHDTFGDEVYWTDTLAVVKHYDRVLRLRMTTQQQAGLVQYVKSL